VQYCWTRTFRKHVRVSVCRLRRVMDISRHSRLNYLESHPDAGPTNSPSDRIFLFPPPIVSIYILSCDILFVSQSTQIFHYILFYIFLFFYPQPSLTLILILKKKKTVRGGRFFYSGQPRKGAATNLVHYTYHLTFFANRNDRAKR